MCVCVSVFICTFNFDFCQFLSIFETAFWLIFFANVCFCVCFVCQNELKILEIFFSF